MKTLSEAYELGEAAGPCVIVQVDIDDPKRRVVRVLGPFTSEQNAQAYLNGTTTSGMLYGSNILPLQKPAPLRGVTG